MPWPRCSGHQGGFEVATTPGRAASSPGPALRDQDVEARIGLKTNERWNNMVFTNLEAK